MFVWLSDTLDRAESAISVYSSLILSVIFAVILVFISTREFNVTSAIVTLLLSGLIFLLITSTRGDNLAGSLPTTTYPIPPHLGLDGVNIQNRFPYRQRHL
jgi:uncharacterized membrane protein YjgN (DUF898 family)